MSMIQRRRSRIRPLMACWAVFAGVTSSTSSISPEGDIPLEAEELQLTTPTYEKPPIENDMYSDENDEINIQYSSASLKRPMQIGSEHKVPNFLSSDLDISVVQPSIEQTTSSISYTYLVSEPAASYLSLHFQDFDLPEGCRMTMLDGAGEFQYELKGKGRHDLGHDFWAQHVQGDELSAILTCPNPETMNKTSFVVDDYVVGYPQTERRNRLRRLSMGADFPRNDAAAEDLRLSLERALGKSGFSGSRKLNICGRDDRKNAICYKQSHPTLYNKARAVARMLVNGRGLCTGWLVGPDNLLLTNQHCIGSQRDVLNTDFEFMAETPECDTDYSQCRFSCGRGEIFEALSLLVEDEELDFALIKLGGNPAQEYGYLELDNRDPIVDEEIFLPNHSAGLHKQFGVDDDNETGGVCRILGPVSGCYKKQWDTSYTCDSLGGSSGSPVISRSNNKVIALHHCGYPEANCLGNMGVPVTQFYDYVAPFLNLPPSVPATPSESSCDPSSEYSFLLELTTDYYASETRWTLENVQTGSIIASGGAYSNAQRYETAVCLNDGIYRFTMLDTNGDGMCCKFGAGSYVISLDEEVIAEGGSFGSSESFVFEAPFERTPAPTPFKCTDDSSWTITVKGRKRNCRWVKDKPGKRCSKTGNDGRQAVDACYDACDSPCLGGGSGVSNEPPPPGPSQTPNPPSPGTCEDDPNWKKTSRKRTRNCRWVKKKPGKRCGKVVGDDGTVARDGCRKSCNNCSATSSQTTSIFTAINATSNHSNIFVHDE